MALGNCLTDLVFCEIFKNADVETLMVCRLVSRSWNREIIRLNRYTKKIATNFLIMELDSRQFQIYIDVSNCGRIHEVPEVCAESVRASIRHLAPPKVLNFLLHWNTQDAEFCEMMKGFTDWWCRSIKELEIVTYSSVKLSKVINRLKMFPNVGRLSLSHYCSETISCGEIFKKLPVLRFFRLFGFNSNDGSGESSGLVFDDESIDELVKNQIRDKRRFQRLELFNTDILFSSSKFNYMLEKLANVPFDPDTSIQPELYKDPEEDVRAIHILFDNCQWESMTERDLLRSICHVARKTYFPFSRSDHIDKFIGDYKFIVSDVTFVLKFTTRQKDD